MLLGPTLTDEQTQVQKLHALLCSDPSRMGPGPERWAAQLGVLRAPWPSSSGVHLSEFQSFHLDKGTSEPKDAHQGPPT